MSLNCLSLVNELETVNKMYIDLNKKRRSKLESKHTSGDIYALVTSDHILYIGKTVNP